MAEKNRNLSNAQQFRRARERTLQLRDDMNDFISDQQAINAQHDRDIKVINSRLADVEQQLRDRNEIEQDWQSW